MFEGDGGWGIKPPPLEYAIDAKNPWAKCVGKGSGSKPSKSFLDFEPPKPPMPGSSGSGQVEIDGSYWQLGTSLIAGSAKLAAVTGSAIRSNPKGGISDQSGNFDWVWPSIDWRTIIAWLTWIATSGSVGDGAMMGGVDPPDPNYPKRVVPPAVRKIALPTGGSKAFQAMADALARLQQAALGEVEIIDRARSAGQADDAKAFHDQVGDLFMVQTLKNEQMKAAAAALAAVTEEGRDLLGTFTVPAGMPLRDLAAPLYALRPALESIGVSAAELNATLFHLRVPSPLLDACEDYVQAEIARTRGDPAAMVSSLVDDLQGLDFVDLEPFEEPPKG